MKVLIIEHSRSYHAFLSRLFESLGYEAVVVQTRQEALSQMAKEPFDIICLNLYFDKGNAIDFTPELRKLDSRVAVLMLTSSKDQQVRAGALASGITEVIYKGNMREMSGAISTFVRQHLRPSIANHRVLYIEDSRTESTIIGRLLRRMGLLVDIFVSAEEAMQQLGRQDYDLVITDLLLKGERTGLSLVTHIRNLPGERGRLPVLTITGFDDLAKRIELLRAGTNDYIVKPVIREELEVRVTNLITNKLLIDKVVSQQARMFELAVTDQLTGCYNRHGFKEFTSKYIAGARRRREPISMLVLDLDHFKLVNDNHGHEAGDKVLAAIGSLLREACRADDVVARFGGEEFVVLLPNCGKRAASAAGQRLRKSISGLRPAGIDITCSIGVTTIEPSEEIDLERAFRQADKAVYRAKKRGRNCVSFQGYIRRKRRPGTAAG